MNINATTTSSAASSNGLSGMVSGMDTESMVQSMLSGVQTKIDKQKQQQQVLTWQQESYRDVITKINDFQDKYFSLTSNTSLRSTSTFNASTAASSSDAVKIISSAGADEQNFNVKVNSLASAASVSSGKVSTNKVTMNSTASNYDRKVKFSVKTGTDDEGKDTFRDVEIDLAEIAKSVSKDADGKTNTEEFANALNSRLQSEGMTEISLNFKAKDPDDENSYDSIEFTSSSEFKISGSTGGLAMIGYRGDVSSSKAEKADESDPDSYTLKTGTVNPDIKLNGEVTISLDGNSKTFKLDEGQTLMDIKTDIYKAFGSGINIADNNGKIELSANGTGRSVSVSGNDDVLGTLGVSKDNAASGISFTAALKDVATSNGGTIGSGKLKINDVEIEYSENDTISQVLSKINNSGAGVKMAYNGLSDTFSISNVNTGSDFALNIADDGNFLSALGFDMNSGQIDTLSPKYKAGANAQFEIDGNTIERAGNTINYNGVTFEMKKVTSENVEITSDKNVDKVYDTIKSFVDDYNTLIGDLNKLIHEEATYKKYPPLTEAQKKEMTDKEIELWDEKSKKGLLHNDSDISKFLQDMRAAIYTKGSDSSLVLSNIGINSSSNWKDYGKLSIDEDTLKKALKTNGEAITDMFTNVESGLATRLNTACKNAANTSSGSPGRLVSLAGVVGKATEKQNTIYKKLEQINNKLKTLNTLYDKKKNKYWEMFNKMETTLSNYASQSDYLAQM